MTRLLAVDIDETLALTNLFWAQHHIKIYGSPEGLTAEGVIKKYRFVKNVPYWQFEEANLWIEAHINSNEAKLEIPVIEEAIDVIRNIPVGCYLSNRPENTYDGTRRWLKKYGFPDKEIFISNTGLRWKARKLEEMFPDISGIIDDNLELLDHIPPDYKGRIFLYSHSEQPNSSLDVIVCPIWPVVEKEVHLFI